MGKFCFIMAASATIFMLIVTAALYKIGLLGLYGQLADTLIGGATGLIGLCFGGMIAIKNT